ncbi:MAG: hypothetical protein DRJ09_05070, partial [Bacteroidetes bacterium]
LYFRFVFKEGERLIGSYNPEIKENIAHDTFTRHFKNLGLPVPGILARSTSFEYFILEDAGDTTLFDLLLQEGLSEKVKHYYFRVVDDLVRFQTEAIHGLDLSVAFPAGRFDKRSVLWDLNYFKYYFVKTNDIIFDENLLEDDFILLAAQLLQSKSDFFMYRDFQARNIMINKEALSYIDFQGGRKGPLQYDVISLLYQAKANLPEAFREELLNAYLEKLDSKLPGQKDKFLITYPLFIFFRLMQVLGAYGFRGLYQRKTHFLQSIPYAIENLRWVTKRYPMTDFPELNKIFDQITELKDYHVTPFSNDKLTVSLSSFSYKRSGIPVDITENGGGYVFDCRALPNPGRINELKDYTGLQEPVITYLEGKQEMADFLAHVSILVDQSIDNYLQRGFSNLMVSFGCTGGKHRSVYSAENMKRHLKEKYGNRLEVRLTHIQLKKEGRLL